MNDPMSLRSIWLRRGLVFNGAVLSYGDWIHCEDGLDANGQAIHYPPESRIDGDGCELVVDPVVIEAIECEVVEGDDVSGVIEVGGEWYRWELDFDGTVENRPEVNL